jgi:hypothetical protein
MLRHAAFVRTDVSEELGASIIRVTRIGELGTLAVNYQPMHATKKYKVRKEASMESRLRMQRGVGVAGRGMGL